MKIRLVWILPVLLAGLIVWGCSPKSRYERSLNRGLASGVRHDTLFMGIYFGMSDKDFYSHCWMLNREGLIKQGTSNMSVERALKEELAHPATMNFYPEFGEGKIVEMTVRFIYNGWAPWNEELSSESLQQDVLSWYKKIYGNGFITVEHSSRGQAHIRIDGNRRITIFKDGDDMHVWAVFTDMLALKDPNKSGSDAVDLYEEITKDLVK
ncbi:MAG: hypothetical protein KAT15_27115 [Bacteroidales bacterium]|nr:hypothetical protein [Bacteroidales bacterium]